MFARERKIKKERERGFIHVDSHDFCDIHLVLAYIYACVCDLCFPLKYYSEYWYVRERERERERREREERQASYT